MNQSSSYLRVTLGCALIAGAGIGLFGNSIGVFTATVCQELGFSRGAFSLYNTISTLVCAASLPLYSRMLKTFKINHIMAICATGCCIAPIIYAFSSKLWQFYLGGIINGIFINGITMMSASALLSLWFVEKRTQAVGIAYSGVGIIAAIFIPILRFSIKSLGWRISYGLVSIIGGVIIFPTIAFLISTPPQEKEPVQTIATKPFNFKDKAFLFVCAALLLSNLINLALYNNALAFLEHIGFNSFHASLGLSGSMLLMLISKPLVGKAFDNLGIKKGSLIISAALLVTSIVAWALPFGKWLIVPFAVGLSICATANAIPASGCAQNLFSGDYTTILSFLTMASYIGSAFGTPLGALSFDLTQNYSYGWAIFAVMSLLVGYFFSKGVSSKEGNP